MCMNMVQTKFYGINYCWQEVHAAKIWLYWWSLSTCTFLQVWVYLACTFHCYHPWKGRSPSKVLTNSSSLHRHNCSHHPQYHNSRRHLSSSSSHYHYHRSRFFWIWSVWIMQASVCMCFSFFFVPKERERDRLYFFFWARHFDIEELGTIMKGVTVVHIALRLCWMLLYVWQLNELVVLHKKKMVWTQE